MKRILNWLYFELKWHKYIKYEKRENANYAAKAHKYAGKETLDAIQANRVIYDAIIDKKPFFAGRIGGNEMNVIAYTCRNDLFPFRTDARKECVRDLCKGAGFFPNNVAYGERFAKLMMDAARNLDLDGIWSRYMEEWFLKEYAQDSKSTWLHNLEPWNVDITSGDVVRWTYALDGKKVLVIHPFTDTIREQYEQHRIELFENIDVNMLPEFELVTLKAVQSMGGHAEGFNDWFEAYTYMYEECQKIDFDVAIIGCGAYGFPLGSAIKKMGKVAIHLGGVTQLLFGIRGKRWDSYGGIYESMINDKWTRPSEDEVTDVMKKVEGGCYC